MFRQRKVLALIPARGGSKGIPGKNLRVVRGKPLIAHTVEAAIASTIVDRVFVSSDNDGILKVAVDLGAEAIKREAIAASDIAVASEVVVDFIRQLPGPIVNENPFIVYLQPTSPLRTAEHVDRAFHEMETKNGSTSVSVVLLKRTPFKSFKLSSEGLLEALFEEKLSNTNRQSLPPTYYPNGAIYIFPLFDFRNKGGFPSNGSVPFLMSEKESVDIDSEEDIAMVESL